MYRIFIDGKEGTTGLQIYERLGSRNDISLITLSDDMRKDTEYRKMALNSCDVAFLCLPDDAAIQAVEMIENPDVRVIDTSTAHRTAPGWAYGFPELSEAHRAAIAESRRVASPGCHASGFIALVYPLIAGGLLPKTAKLTCHSVTGYSGGGKKMIAQYQGKDRDALLGAPRQYSLSQGHKHLPEMKSLCSLEHEPIFCPIVGDFYSGMCVTVPLFTSDLAPGVTASDIREVYASLYFGPVVKYLQGEDEGGFVSAAAVSDTDSMQIIVEGNDDRLLLISRFDNLGKGAGGAAVECLNIMLGLDPVCGLEL